MTSLRHDVTTAWLAVLLTVTSSVTSADESGCAGLGVCCLGRNVTCRSTGRSAGSKDASSTCFCDEHCLTVADCCLDYRTACPRLYIYYTSLHPRDRQCKAFVWCLSVCLSVPLILKLTHYGLHSTRPVHISSLLSDCRYTSYCSL